MILYSSSFIPLNNSEFLKTNEAESYIFLKVPGLKLAEGKMLKYNLIVENNKLDISVVNFKEENVNRISNIPVFKIEDVNRVIILNKK